MQRQDRARRPTKQETRSASGSAARRKRSRAARCRSLEAQGHERRGRRFRMHGLRKPDNEHIHEDCHGKEAAKPGHNGAQEPCAKAPRSAPVLNGVVDPHRRRLPPRSNPDRGKPSRSAIASQQIFYGVLSAAGNGSSAPAHRAPASAAALPGGSEVEKLAPLAMEAQARNCRRRHFRSRGRRKRDLEHTGEEHRAEKADEPGHDGVEAAQGCGCSQRLRRCWT